MLVPRRLRTANDLMSCSSEVSILAFLAVFTAASAGWGSARVSASPSMNWACVVQGQCRPRAPRGTRWKRPNRSAGQGGASQTQHETRVRGPPRRGGGRQRLRPAAAGQCSARRSGPRGLRPHPAPTARLAPAKDHSEFTAKERRPAPHFLTPRRGGFGPHSPSRSAGTRCTERQPPSTCLPRRFQGQL